MRRLIEHRYVLRNNLLLLTGICMCLYFTYHIVYGNRGALRYYYLNQAIQETENSHNQIVQKRATLEARVARLRSNTLDVDFLEELAHKNLGYVPEDALVYIGSPPES